MHILVHFIQAVLHFRTLRLQQDGSVEEGDVLDDTRKMVTGPFELLMGREFKLGVWEEMVKTMRIGEIARFKCPFKVCMVVVYLDFCVLSVFLVLIVAKYLSWYFVIMLQENTLTFKLLLRHISWPHLRLPPHSLEMRLTSLLLYASI